jgi:glycosyltransferase involved in cell wall biosynthesis
MPRANASLCAALGDLGWSVDNVYLEDLPGFVNHRWASYPAFGPTFVRLLKSLEAHRDPYDIIQISGGDGFIAPLLRRDQVGRRRLIVAKCHGLEHRYWTTFLRQVSLRQASVTIRHRLYFGRLRLLQVEHAVRHSDLFNCHTNEDAAFVIDRGWKAPQDICTVGEGAAASWFEVARQRRMFRGRLLWSGSWTWMKGCKLLPIIFGRLVREADLTLTVIGTGVSAGEVLGAFPPEVRERVKVEPGLTHEEVLTAFKTHDLLLATSHFEGFGTVIIEAMAAGLPVVAADVASAHAYITDGKTGYLVRPGDIDGFVQKTEVLLQRLRQGEQEPMGLAASRAVSSLTWQNVAAQTVSAYEEGLIRVRAQHD